jgi:hypothetical protein
MHPHGLSMHINAANFNAISSNARQIAAERAAETRKRLSKSAASLSGAASDEETALIGHWLDPDSDPPNHSSGDETDYQPGSNGNLPGAA